MSAEMGIGIVGCGAISEVYLQNLSRFPGVRVVHVADVLEDRARAMAEQHHVPAASGLDALLANEDVQLVLNLTIPRAHAEVSLLAIDAGKSVYSEKPLAGGSDDGRRILDAAVRRGVRVGSAPDTFYGPAAQAARAVIDRGGIGKVIGGAAFMLSPGHESWHPSPAFYYQHGGGPLHDMGPYYLSALINLLGPVARVRAVTTTTHAQRTITSQPLAGTIVDVEVPTHVSALVEFVMGGTISLVMSFDVVAAEIPPIQLWGTEGSVLLPDPNGFGGQVSVQGRRDAAWHVVNPAGGSDWRGIGVADMSRAMRDGDQQRAGGALAFHVLDVMDALLRAGE
ncbi:MAG: Gfo/Idh/MocA family protein, partial [Candidatus Dormibacteria bacterium]